MNIDRETHDYVAYPDLGKNVFIRTEKDEPLGDVQIQNIIRDLIKRLSKRKPEWQVVLTSSFVVSNGQRRIHRGNVYHDEEYLGFFAYTYNYGKASPAISYDSPSLCAVRQRGHCSETIDINKALKAIEKHFFKKPIKNKLNEKYNEASMHIGRAYNDKIRVFNSVKSDIEPAFIKFVWDNIGEFEDRLTAKYGVTPQILEQRHNALAEASGVEEIKRVLSGERGGLVLVVMGDEYVRAAGKPEDEPTRYTSETLPSMYKAQLGMLKLVDYPRLITGVGARVSADTFVLLEPKETTDDDRGAT